MFYLCIQLIQASIFVGRSGNHVQYGLVKELQKIQSALKISYINRICFKILYNSMKSLDKLCEQIISLQHKQLYSIRQSSCLITRSFNEQFEYKPLKEYHKCSQICPNASLQILLNKLSKQNFSRCSPFFYTINLKIAVELIIKRIYKTKFKLKYTFFYNLAGMIYFIFKKVSLSGSSSPYLQSLQSLIDSLYQMLTYGSHWQNDRLGGLIEYEIYRPFMIGCILDLRIPLQTNSQPKMLQIISRIWQINSPFIWKYLLRCVQYYLPDLDYKSQQMQKFTSIMKQGIKQIKKYTIQIKAITSTSIVQNIKNYQGNQIIQRLQIKDDVFPLQKRVRIIQYCLEVLQRFSEDKEAHYNKKTIDNLVQIAFEFIQMRSYDRTLLKGLTVEWIEKIGFKLIHNKSLQSIKLSSLLYCITQTGCTNTFIKLTFELMQKNLSIFIEDIPQQRNLSNQDLFILMEAAVYNLNGQSCQQILKRPYSIIYANKQSLKYVLTLNLIDLFSEFIKHCFQSLQIKKENAFFRCIIKILKIVRLLCRRINKIMSQVIWIYFLELYMYEIKNFDQEQNQDVKHYLIHQLKKHRKLFLFKNPIK